MNEHSSSTIDQNVKAGNTLDMCTFGVDEDFVREMDRFTNAWSN